MRLHICAVGRLRSGPELDMIRDYLQRFERTGRALSLGPVAVTEVEDKKGLGPEAEEALLSRAIRDGALICCLDERGKTLSSPAFSKQLLSWRDSGRQDLAFVIGGADGLTEGFRNRADALLSFGKMVWPHMLARVMLSEQLYRASTIAAGLPYHRA